MARECYGKYPETIGYPCMLCEDEQYCKMKANGNDFHDLKCWPEYFEEIFIGNKNFEIRVNDRNYKVGDVLYLREYNPQTKKYTGREIKRKVTYILSDSNFVKEGMVAMSLSYSS